MENILNDTMETKPDTVVPLSMGGTFQDPQPVPEPYTYCVASYTYVPIWRAPRIFPGGFPRRPKWLGLNAAGSGAHPESAQVCDRGDTGRVRTQGGKHCSGPMSKWVWVHLHACQPTRVRSQSCLCVHTCERQCVCVIVCV